MSKMLKTHRNTIGNLMITLLFVGGCIFLLTGSWDASEVEAAKCCCGGADFGSDIPMDAEVTDGCCGGEGKVIPSSSNNNGDGDGDDDPPPDPDCECLGEGLECGECGEKGCDGPLEACPSGDCFCDICDLGCENASDPCSGIDDKGNCTSESYD